MRFLFWKEPRFLVSPLQQMHVILAFQGERLKMTVYRKICSPEAATPLVCEATVLKHGGFFVNLHGKILTGWVGHLLSNANILILRQLYA